MHSNMCLINVHDLYSLLTYDDGKELNPSVSFNRGEVKYVYRKDK